jgi:hypothetical protein
MQLNRLTTQLNPGLVRDRKPVDIGRALHPQGMPAPADFPVPQDLAVRLHPPELQPEVTVRASRPAPDFAAALHPEGLPPSTSAPPTQVDFAAALNPPELQPSPRPVAPQQPVNIRQILDSPQGRLAENFTGSLTYLD